MKVLVLSDIHENFNNLRLVLHYAQIHNIDTGLVLGDLINPGIMSMLGKSQMKLYVVLGNNDGDKVGIAQQAGKFPEVRLEDIILETEIDGRHLFLCHYNRIGELVAQSGVHDAVFCGHNHKFERRTFHNGKTLLINPGEVSGHLTGRCTFGVWETQDNSFSLIEVTKGWVDVKKYEREEGLSILEKDYFTILDTQ